MVITNEEKLSFQKFVVSPADSFTQKRHIMTELLLTLNIINAMPQLTARILPGVFVHITLFKISIHNRQTVQSTKGHQNCSTFIHLSNSRGFPLRLSIDVSLVLRNYILPLNYTLPTQVEDDLQALSPLLVVNLSFCYRGEL